MESVGELRHRIWYASTKVIERKYVQMTDYKFLLTFLNCVMNLEISANSTYFKGVNNNY